MFAVVILIELLGSASFLLVEADKKVIIQIVIRT